MKYDTCTPLRIPNGRFANKYERILIFKIRQQQETIVQLINEKKNIKRVKAKMKIMFIFYLFIIILIILLCYLK